MSRIPRLLAGAVITAFALGGPALAQEPAKRPPFATTKVDGTDNVYVFRYQNHQSMFVVTSDGVIATDPIFIRAAAGRSCLSGGNPEGDQPACQVRDLQPSSL